MRTIEKKVWPEYFEALLKGTKNYELRLADFECEPGDLMILREWDPRTKLFTGRQTEKKVTYVGRTKDYRFWSDEEIERFGYQIIAFGEGSDE